MHDGNDYMVAELHDRMIVLVLAVSFRIAIVYLYKMSLVWFGVQEGKADQANRRKSFYQFPIQEVQIRSQKNSSPSSSACLFHSNHMFSFPSDHQTSYILY